MWWSQSDLLGCFRLPIHPINCFGVCGYFINPGYRHRMFMLVECVTLWRFRYCCRGKRRPLVQITMRVDSARSHRWRLNKQKPACSEITAGWYSLLPGNQIVGDWTVIALTGGYAERIFCFDQQLRFRHPICNGCGKHFCCQKHALVRDWGFPCGNSLPGMPRNAGGPDHHHNIPLMDIHSDTVKRFQVTFVVILFLVLYLNPFSVCHHGSSSFRNVR